MAAEPAESQLSPLRFLGRALAHPNYRLYFIGQGISLIGTWMTRVATGWLVYRLAADHAALMLGVVGFTGQIPLFFLAPFAGVLIDRWNRHRTLIVTQILALIQSALLAVVAFQNEPGAATLWQIVALSLFQGFINAFDMPARQVLLVELIERREDLPNAIALNSFLVNGGRLIGPALAGLIIVATGEAWCFVIDAVSYLFVIAALLLMRLSPRTRAVPVRAGVAAGVAEGFAYAFGFAPIRALLLLMAVVGFLGLPYTVLLPLFAADLGGGAGILGLLAAASGLGALIGAIYLASRPSVLGLGRLIAFGSLCFGLGLIGLALSRWLWLSALMMGATGFGMIVQLAACNTILQTIADPDKRGRVMSFYSMAVLGVGPFGSLCAGLAAGWYGAPATVLVCGIGCLIGGLFFARALPGLRAIVRPIYARLGILPEIATGMQSAADLTSSPGD